VRNKLPVDFLPNWKFKKCKISSMMDAADIIVEIGGIFQNSLINPSDSRADDFAYSYFLQL
jgi:hypothetical protein